MAGIISGQGTALQIGKETAWGTAVPATEALNFLNESLKLTVERKEEDTLVGGKTSSSMDIMKRTVSGDFGIIMKPKNVGLLIGLALGEEDAVTEDPVGVQKHVFRPIAAGVYSTLPSFTATVDRHVAAKKYTGLKIDSFKLEAKAGDYLRATFSVKGKDEESGTKDGLLSVPAMKAFRFAGGSCTFDSSAVGGVKSISIDYQNTLDEGEQTLSSGLNGTENQPQERKITVTIEADYDAGTEAIRENDYKKDATVNVQLRFESPETIITGTKHALEISMPKVAITECSPNVGGKEKLNLSITGTALESALIDAIEIALFDDVATAYV